MSGPGQAGGIPGRGEVSLGARFVLLALVALIVMVIDHRYDHLRRVREVLGLAVLPIQVVVDMPFSAWAAVRDGLTDRNALMAENERLNLELMMNEVRLQRLESLERENETLRQMLNSPAGEDEVAFSIAEIVAQDLDNRQRFMINRGSVDGVCIGQPLIDAYGVVGQVRAVFMTTAEAMTITDANHVVPVAVQRTGLRTLAEGTGDSGMLRLSNLPISADIEVGDQLVTSGLGGVFPRGRPVGEIVDIQEQPGRDFWLVEARPVAALDRDHEVLLVWDREPTDPCSGQEPSLSLLEEAG